MALLRLFYQTRAKGLPSMCEPFIRNHQYNVIRKQAEEVVRAYQAISDPKVLESVRYGAQEKVLELFPNVTEDCSKLLTPIIDLQTVEAARRYVAELEPYLVEFPSISVKQIQKLFPKNKKLKLPDLSQIDYRYVSYLSWSDLSTNKMYIVYDAGGQFVGIEGRYTIANKKSYCFVCNKFEKLALFSAVSKKRHANLPDYYKSVGNYICMNGHDCNRNITDVTALEKFITSVVH